MVNPLDSASNIVGSLSEWAKEPFRSEMNLFHWFLLTGVVLVFVILWTLILREIRGAV